MIFREWANRLRRRRTRADRGAVLVELGIVLPLLCILCFGALEFGLLLNHAHEVSNGARIGARAGTTTLGGTSPDDYYILNAIKNDRALLNRGPIQTVTVFKTTAANGSLPAGCASGSVDGRCNVYTGAQVQATALNSPLQQPWHPSSRTPGVDFIGVEIVAKHNWVTGFFGRNKVVRDRVIMRLEPTGGTENEDIPGADDTVRPSTSTTERTGTTVRRSTTTGLRTTTSAGRVQSSTTQRPATTRAPTTTTAKPAGGSNL